MGLANRDYMRERRAAGYGQGRPVDRANHRAHDGVAYRPWLGFLLAFCSIGTTAYRTFYNQDLADLFRREGAPIRFPNGGSVTVSPLALEDGPRSIFGVTVPPADPDNYVVRLDRPEDDRMVISIYVRSGDSVKVPVPAGPIPFVYRTGIDGSAPKSSSADPRKQPRFFSR